MKGKIYSKKVSVIISFAAFFIALAVLLFAAYPLQIKLGNTGVVITELLMLGIAIAGCLATRQKLSEMFPMRLPELRHVFGAIVIWAAMYLMSMTASVVSGILMPDRFLAVSAAFDGMSFPFKLIVLAMLPPICEEAVHRGLVTHFLKPIEHRWIIILIIGVQFGVLHWEPVKFLSTAIAGACLTYVLLKSNNIILCAIIHFLNNLPAVFVDTGASDFSEMTAVADVAGNITEIAFEEHMMQTALGASAGLFLILCAAVPWLLYAGSVLLGNKGQVSPCRKKKITVCTVLCILSAVIGFVVLAVSAVQLAASVSSQLM